MNSRKIETTIENNSCLETCEMWCEKKSNRILIFFSIHAGDHSRIANAVPSAVNTFRRKRFPCMDNMWHRTVEHTTHIFYGCENCRCRRCGKCISLLEYTRVSFRARSRSPTDVIKRNSTEFELNAGCFISHTVAWVVCRTRAINHCRCGNLKNLKSMCRCDDNFTTLLSYSYALFIASLCGFRCILRSR